jgi:hypothetical protein
MFYGRSSIDEQFKIALDKISEQELFVFIPMPDFKLNERWTDEFRIRDGHTKLADGSWVTVCKLTDYVERIFKSTVDLHDQFKDTYKELQLERQRNYEMEYGLRVAQKSLNKALAIKGEDDEQNVDS